MHIDDVGVRGGRVGSDVRIDVIHVLRELRQVNAYI